VYISCNELKNSTKCFSIMQHLIENDYKVFFDTNKKSVKNQMRDAIKRNASFVLVIDKNMTIKNIKSNEKIVVSDFQQLLNFLKTQ